VVRRILLCLALVGGLVGAQSGCSTDPDTSLGAGFIDDILGSRPGVVLQDTIDVVEDTVLAYAALLTNDDDLEVGRRSGYSRAAVIRPDFSKTDGDENRVVSKAFLRMRLKSGEEVAARFYQLAFAYTEGDSMATLDTLSAVLDPDSNRFDRIMTFAQARHPLPAQLVQGWIRGDSASNGLVVVYLDDGNERVAVFDASEKTGVDSDPPTIQVDFTDLTSSSYPVTNDAVFVRPTTGTSNLIASDGYLRRIWFHLDLTAISDSSAVHSARVTFHVVPGTVSGSDRVELYIPDSGDIHSPSFRTGQLVIDATINTTTESIEFPITNALLSVLSGALPDNGLVMRFVGEKSGVRFVEFYPGASGATRPRAVLTVSTPAGFHE
jgi:hypothetical protein